jgi:predicted RND superfamily exporter protein
VSEAYDALDDVSALFAGGDGTAGSLVIHAANAAEARRELEALASRLDQAAADGTVRRFFVPMPFLPDPARQEANFAGPIDALLAREADLVAALAEAGFDDQAAVLMRAVFASWRSWATVPPENADRTRLATPGARWLLQRLVTRDETGALWASATFQSPAASPSTAARLQSDQVLLADWDLTMEAMSAEVPKEMGKILVALCVLVLVMLALTFRHAGYLVLVLVGLALSFFLLAGAMSFLGWTWNFFNLAAVLLCVGAGLDYSVHVLLAARHGETLAPTRQALLVCSLTSVAGFGSLSWASNLGLASLGRTCALAMAANALVAIFLLPSFLACLPGQRSPAPGS